MRANSIDSLVTDPPAGISFMGKSWDGDKGGRKEWCAWLERVMRECLRVMKPGAHGLVWALPRTSHWTATALEDAGFEIRDCVYHLFGSGFPKSHNISKAIDAAAGAEREVIAYSRTKDIKRNVAADIAMGKTDRQSKLGTGSPSIMIDHPITAPATDAAKQWAGFGTALKPAVECWWLVRKPLSEKTVAANVLKWKTGALNIDAGRIGTSDKLSSGRHITPTTVGPSGYRDVNRTEYTQNAQGRFPSHLLFSCACPDETQHELECAVAELDRQSGIQKDRPAKKALSGEGSGDGHAGMFTGSVAKTGYQTEGGASRFFYCAKTSASERNAGLGDQKSNHPTVKPQKLMRYLAKLVTPPGGTILDPFTGSGSTGVAAKSEGFDFIGIEREQEYVTIAEKRIAHVEA